MEILTPVYLLVKDCYGPTISSKILLAQHTTKVRKTSPHVFKPPRLSIVDNVLNLLSLNKERQHPILTLIFNMLSSIEAHCADGTNLSFLFLYLLIKYASKRSNNSHLIQLLYGQERTLDSILPNNSSFTPFPDPHLLLFREVVEILRKELKSMIISVSLSETTSIDILRKFCYSLLNTKLDVVLSEELSCVCSTLILHSISCSSPTQQHSHYDILLVQQLPNLDTHIPIISRDVHYILTETFVLFHPARNLRRSLAILNPRILVMCESLEEKKNVEFRSVAEHNTFFEEQKTKVCEKVELIVRTGASVLISTAYISSFVAKLLASKGILSFHNVDYKLALQIAQMTGATMISNITSTITSQENEQTTGLLGCVPFVQYLPIQQILTTESEASSKQNNLMQSSSESESWALVIALTRCSESKSAIDHENDNDPKILRNDNSRDSSNRSKYLSLWLRGGKNLKQSIQRVVRVGLCTFDTNSKSFWLLPGGGKWQLSLARALQQFLDRNFSLTQTNETTKSDSFSHVKSSINSHASSRVDLPNENKWREIPFFSLALSATLFSLLELYQHLWKEETSKEASVSEIFDSFSVIDYALSVAMETAETLLRIDQIITPHPIDDISSLGSQQSITTTTSQNEQLINEPLLPIYKEEEYTLKQQMMNRNKDLMTSLERERIKERERELTKKEEQRIRNLEKLLKFSQERIPTSLFSRRDQDSQTL